MAPASWPLFAPRATCKSTRGQEGTLASSGTRTLMRHRNRRQRPRCESNVARSRTEMPSLRTSRLVRSASQIARCGHCAQFHPGRHPDWKALDKLVVRFCVQAIGEEHNHPPHQLGARLNGGSTLVAEHLVDTDNGRGRKRFEVNQNPEKLKSALGSKNVSARLNQQLRIKRKARALSAVCPQEALRS